MPREGQVIAACRATATLPTLRYSTVPACGLRTVLKQEARPLLERFQEASRVIGCYRHLTSLAANALVTRDPERYADVADWKSFYDKVFSAVEAAVLRTSKPANPYAADVAAILDDGNADLDWREALPQKELFDLRQQVAVQMATNAKEHLLQFRERLHAFLVAELAPLAPSLSSASLRSIGWPSRPPSPRLPSQPNASPPLRHRCRRPLERRRSVASKSSDCGLGHWACLRFFRESNPRSVKSSMRRMLMSISDSVAAKRVTSGLFAGKLAPTTTPL